MTALGKLLVFLVLFLSLVWNFLTINAYATRTNWQKEAKKYQEQAQVAADSANKMKALLDAEREANEDAKRSLQQERDRYYSQVAQLLQVRDGLLTQYNIAFTDATKKAADAAKLQAMIDKLGGQVKQLDEEGRRKDDQLVKLVADANFARAEKEKAELTARSLLAQINVKSDALLALQEEFNNYKQDRTGVPGLRTPLAPANFRGTVTRVDGDFIAFTPGADAGLTQGTVLRVQRFTPAGVFLGKLTVTISDPKQAVGRFEPALRNAPRNEANTPKIGDEVSPYNAR